MFNAVTLLVLGLQHCLLHYYSMACAIPDPDTDTVVVTGGQWQVVSTVSVYNVQGWLEELPSLNTRRRRHACTSYMTGGKRVS